MKALYIFPHPDDESFGPGGCMYKQSKEGNEIYLLTLTKGGATKIRHELGLTVEEMGNVREKEMQCVAQTLGLKGLTVLDLPDSGLKHIDPRIIEQAVRSELEKIRPDVVVTYAVHGISGFHDHLVTHAVVKRVFVEMKSEGNSTSRLCFFTVDKNSAEKQSHFRLSHSTDEEIVIREKLSPDDIERGKEALECYVTYRDVIRKAGIKDQLPDPVCFEVFDEKHEKILNSIFQNLNNNK